MNMTFGNYRDSVRECILAYRAANGSSSLMHA